MRGWFGCCCLPPSVDNRSEEEEDSLSLSLVRQSRREKEEEKKARAKLDQAGCSLPMGRPIRPELLLLLSVSLSTFFSLFFFFLSSTLFSAPEVKRNKYLTYSLSLDCSKEAQLENARTSARQRVKRKQNDSWLTPSAMRFRRRRRLFFLYTSFPLPCAAMQLSFFCNWLAY